LSPALASSCARSTRSPATRRTCFQAPPQDTPESAAFLEIHALGAESARVSAAERAGKAPKGPKPIGPDGLLFSGWMFASSPGLSALEHPTYDVWVISCNSSGPEGQ
jgi:hypothetical protein